MIWKVRAHCFSPEYQCSYTRSIEGEELTGYIEKLGWSIDAASGVITIPPNPDNQIESTVVQENIQLPREYFSLHSLNGLTHDMYQSWSRSSLTPRLRETWITMHTRCCFLVINIGSIVMCTYFVQRYGYMVQTLGYLERGTKGKRKPGKST